MAMQTLIAAHGGAHVLARWLLSLPHDWQPFLLSFTSKIHRSPFRSPPIRWCWRRHGRARVRYAMRFKHCASLISRSSTGRWDAGLSRRTRSLLSATSASYRSGALPSYRSTSSGLPPRSDQRNWRSNGCATSTSTQRATTQRRKMRSPNCFAPAWRGPSRPSTVPPSRAKSSARAHSRLEFWLLLTLRTPRMRRRRRARASLTRSRKC